MTRSGEFAARHPEGCRSAPRSGEFEIHQQRVSGFAIRQERSEPVFGHPVGMSALQILPLAAAEFQIFQIRLNGQHDERFEQSVSTASVQ